MPLARYFSLVGGVLLALLFLLDAGFPELPVAARAKVYPPVIRIFSIEKLPERIVYDTSLPTIVPVVAATPEGVVDAPERIAEAAAGAKEREAFAMLPTSVDRSQASGAAMQELKPRHHRKVARKRAPAPRIAMARQPQFSQFGQSGWFGRSFW